MINPFEAAALRPSVIRQQWLPAELAMQEIVEIGKRSGLECFLLACYAALPSNLTPELINLLRINFLTYKGIDCPWIAEADFLLSPLCRPVDDTLYEVEPMVRELLLSELERRYGWQALQEVASFLLQYLKLRKPDKKYPGIAQVQEWIAYSYLQPDKVVQELTALLEKSAAPENNSQVFQYEKLQFATTMEIVADPLKYTTRQQEYQYLIHSARAFARILYGNKDLVRPPNISEQTARNDGNTLTALFPPAVQQWIKSIAPSSAPLTDTSVLSLEVELSAKIEEAPTFDTAVERLLALAGWTLQNYAHADIRSAQGVAIRNSPFRNSVDEPTFINYLLFVDQQLAAAIFVLPDDKKLIGFKAATSLSSGFMLRGEKSRRDLVPFTYETNTQGTRVRFTSSLDPMMRTRSVFAFHRPEILALWLQQSPADAPKNRTDLLRSRLRRMPRLSPKGLWSQQHKVITSLERSLAENRPRTLIQMETGSGKTHAIITSIYRLLTYANAQRVLYLTDQDERARYVYSMFQQYSLPEEKPLPGDDTFPGDGLFPAPHTFPNLYNVQLINNTLITHTNVLVAPIQSLAPLLEKEVTLRQLHTELFSLSEKWLTSGAITPIARRRIQELLTTIQDILSDIFEIDELENITYLTEQEQGKLRQLLSDTLGTLTLEILNDYVILIGDLFSYKINVRKTSIQYNPELPMDAFDIIIIDGSSYSIIQQYRPILEYFDAFLIGLTETNDTRIYGFFDTNIIKEMPTKTEEGIFAPVTVLLCYAYEDERMVQQLKAHLRVLERNKRITLWDDAGISLADEREHELKKHFDEAQIILLLISSSFLASDYGYTIQMLRAIERHERKEARVIPIILRPVDWKESPLDKLQALPEHAKAISTWKNQDEGFADVVKGIVRVIEQWNTQSLPDSTEERKELITHLDQLIEAVKSYLQPPARALAIVNSIQQLSILIPTDVRLADLVVGWRLLSHASGQQEEPAWIQRRVTCGELATLAAQLTTEQGSIIQAIESWRIWREAFSNSDDPRQIAMGRTFARELTELQDILETLQSITFTIEVTSESLQDADTSLISAIGRDSADELRSAGYDLLPSTSGKKDEFYVYVVIPSFTTVWMHKDVILADGSALASILAVAVTSTRHLREVYEKRVGKTVAQQQPIKISFEVDGASVSAEASDMESTEGILQIIWRFRTSYPEIAEKVTIQSTFKVKGDVPKIQLDTAETALTPSDLSKQNVKNFSEVLEEFRQMRGLSKRDLAMRANLTPGYVSHLTRRERTSPAIETVSALANALELDSKDRKLLLEAAGHLAEEF